MSKAKLTRIILQFWSFWYRENLVKYSAKNGKRFTKLRYLSLEQITETSQKRQELKPLIYAKCSRSKLSYEWQSSLITCTSEHIPVHSFVWCSSRCLCAALGCWLVEGHILCSGILGEMSTNTRNYTFYSNSTVKGNLIEDFTVDVLTILTS